VFLGKPRRASGTFGWLGGLPCRTQSLETCDEDVDDVRAIVYPQQPLCPRIFNDSVDEAAVVRESCPFFLVQLDRPQGELISFSERPGAVVLETTSANLPNPVFPRDRRRGVQLVKMGSLEDVDQLTAGQPSGFELIQLRLGSHVPDAKPMRAMGAMKGVPFALRVLGHDE